MSREPLHHKIAAALVVLMIWSPTAVWSAGVQATIDRQSTQVDEPVTLQLTFEGGLPSVAPSLDLPDGLRVASRGTWQRSSFRNGQHRTEHGYQYSLVPTEPGEYEIPSQTITVGGTSYTTEPLSLTARGPDQPAEEREDWRDYAFIDLEVARDAAYVGESFPVTIGIYITPNASNVQRPQLAAEGFTLGPRHETHRGQVHVNGRPYRRFEFRMRVTPVKAGELTLGPATTQMTIEVERRNRSNNRFFGLLPRETRKITIESQPHSVVVHSLPEDENLPGFGGAIGRFDLEVQADRPEVNLGDPVTLTVRIQGEGTLHSLTFPEQPEWEAFKRYPPRSQAETGPLGLEGTKTFEQIVIPQSQEVDAIPPFVFSYFDPAEERYRTLEHPAIPLQVREPEGGAANPLADLPEDADREDALAHIKPRMGEIAEASRPLLFQGWFLGLQALPLLAWLSGFLWRKREEHLAQHPKRRREQRVHHLVRQGLRELRSLAETDDSEAFAGQLFRLLQEQLGERLNLPASAITEQVLENRLSAAGAPQELIDELHRLFQICNEERYAPQRSRQQLHALLPEIEQTLRKLQRLKTHPSQ